MDLNILAQMTAISEKTLMYRTYMLMRQSSIPDEWLNGGDGTFSRHLEQIRLKYSYTKERVMVVKQAIARIVLIILTGNQ